METKRELLIDIIDQALYENEDKYNKMYTRESTFQNELVKVLKKLFKDNIWFAKISDRYNKGIPDIVGCICGRFFALELKRDNGKPSALQLYNIEKIEQAGGKVCIVRTMAESLKTIRSILMT